MKYRYTESTLKDIQYSWLLRFHKGGKTKGFYEDKRKFKVEKHWSSLQKFDEDNTPHTIRGNIPIFQTDPFLIFIFIIFNTKTFCIGVYSQLTKLGSFKGLSHAYICTHSPQSPLPSSLAHNIEQSSMCYKIDVCQLSVLHIAVCM